MAIHFHHANAGTNSALLTVWMQELHDLLLAAGWTIEYADADAIGGGSSGSPAWDKAPSNNTDAGIAVYRMPVDGARTRWYVRLRPGWASSTVRGYMRGVTIGTTHDGTGEVTGTEITSANATASTVNAEFAIAASEAGFALILNPDVVVSAERARLPSDDVQDGMVVSNAYGIGNGALVTTVATTSFATEIVLRPHQLSSPSIPVGSLESVYLDGPLIAGPYRLVGNPFLDVPRLFRLVYTGNDFTAGATIEMDVDGGLKTYRLLNTEVSNAYGVFAVATE